jgi:hypothetical protein
MVQVSMIGYAAGGAFLGLAYFDLYYHLIVMVLVASDVAARQGQTVADMGDQIAKGETLPHPSSRLKA